MPEAPLRSEADLRPFTIAILAMGGEGGGVLANWLLHAAEASGLIAQSTSVPGVAQRTGATIYYLELFPGGAEREPVLALMPAPGAVDLVVASELMEAGRAIQRGLVDRDLGAFIFSTHRVFAVAEKIVPSDGRVDQTALLNACLGAARHVIAGDMQAVAARTGAHLSAVLLGAIAGAGILPIPLGSYEDAIRGEGTGVEASLAGFAAGLALERVEPAARPAPPEIDLAAEGIRRLTDYQDAAYAALYLARLERLGFAGELARETARHLALWMSYEDTIRVADLKTRAARLARVRAEVRARPDQLLRITEFLHPRVEEIADTLPVWMARILSRPGLPRRLAMRATRRGRHIETTSIHGFLLLRAVAALRRFRRGTARFQREQRRIEAWLDRAAAAAPRDPALALEIVRCQGLVKGYGETHDRGWSRFERLMQEVDRPGFEGFPDAAAAERLKQLREAALADETGEALTKVLMTP